jgi:hypothetical protein
MKKVEFKLPPIADKVSSIFAPHKKPVPMFNQPLPSGCPHHRISRLLYAIFLSLLIAVAIPVVTLKALTYSFIEENRDMGFVFETTEDDGTEGMSVVMAALPRMLHHAPAKLALVAAVLSIFSGLAHLGFVIVDWKDGKRVRRSPLYPSLPLLRILTLNLKDTSLGLPPQHHVPAHHVRHPRPLRPRLNLRNPPLHLALPRRIR